MSTKNKKETENLEKEFTTFKSSIPFFLMHIIKDKETTNRERIEALKCFIEYDTRYKTIFQ